MKHILYLIDSLGLGGAETIVVNTLNYIVDTQKETEVSIITTVKPNGCLRSKLNASIYYQYINCTNTNFLKGVLAIKKYSKDQNVTHIHSHLFHSIIVGRLVTMSEINLFETYHNLEYNKDSVYYSWWRVLLDKLTFKKKTFSIYVSTEVNQSIQHIRKIDHPHLIINNFAGVEFTTAYQFKNTNDLKLIAVGNLKQDKNYEFALRTFIKLKKNSISLDIYGDGHLRTELEDFINVNKIKVRLMGSKRIDTNLLIAYDAFLMTSLNEGMPISLLEAMGVGLPSILPNHLTVMKEVAQKSAHYFSIKNDIELPNLLLEILKNKEVLSTFSKEATKRSKLYSIETHVSKLFNVYSRCQKLKILFIL